MSSLPSESTVPKGLVESWRADTASPAELRRGYGRFLRTQSRSAPSRLLGRWLVLGALLGGGLAQGATVVAKHWEAARVRSLTIAAPPALAPSASPLRPMPRAPAPVIAQPLEAPLPSTLDAPEVRATAPAAPTAHGSAARLEAPASSTRASSQRWQQAAAAMRVKDFAGADSALRELEQTTRGSERDAVLLTRAQLLASTGRSTEAVALARRVQAQSSSSMMRDKARELAERLSENLPSDRSTLPGAAIKQP
jgi:hypothetical protein